MNKAQARLRRLFSGFGLGRRIYLLVLFTLCLLASWYSQAQALDMPMGTEMSSRINMMAAALTLLAVGAGCGIVWGHWFYRVSRMHPRFASDDDRWAQALGRVDAAFWDWDVANNHLKLSGAWYHMVGETPKNVDKHPAAFVIPEHQARVSGLLQQLLRGEISRYVSEHGLFTADGRELWVLEIAHAVERDADGNPSRVIGIVCDASDRRSGLSHMEYLASHDTLTGLPNRSLFNDRLQQSIVRAQRKGSMVAVIFMDVDHFKRVNDQLGHRAGDQVLNCLARTMQQSLRSMDTVSRRGGDEFVILLPEMESVAQVGKVCEKLMRKVKEPLVIDSGPIQISVSMGVSMYPTDAGDSETLLEVADMALYRSKSAGRGCVTFYETEFGKVLQHATSLDAKMRQALVGGRFTMWYQPQFDLRSGELYGVEALMRWVDEDGSMLLPAEFIPLAEKFGHIHELGDWSFAEACREAKILQDRLGRPLKVSVNVSAAQFRRPGLMNTIQHVLDDVGWPAQQLTIETAEAVVLDEADTAQQTLSALGGAGVHLAIDNFGSGYSSMSVLRRLHVDHLKIDRSLVRGLGVEPEHMVIVSGIIQLAHGLGLKVIAEGVETPLQAELLTAHGCDVAQGFLFSPAVPRERLRQMKENKAWDHEMEALSVNG